MIHRQQHPFLTWLIEHLPDAILFCITTPVAMVALLLHFT